ncbi:MAG: phytoene desaturase family protein [Acidimicrobiales bacterium]
MPDAVVIGAGPNGLVGANLLADAGWDVLVLEAADAPGGAVRTVEVTAPGFRNDLFSAFYPLAAVSPALARLDLESCGLRWVHAPLVVANPTPDGPTAVLSRDIDTTAESLDAFAPGDGAAWRALYERTWPPLEALLHAMLEPLGSPRATGRLARQVKVSGAMPFARLAVATVRHLAEEEFQGEGARLLLGASALHTDLSPEGAGSALFGLIMAVIGQRHGFPVPEGGAQAYPDALVRRLEARGGRVECGQRVVRVIVRDGRAVAVRTEGGDEIAAARSVLADCDAAALYADLVGEEHLPARVVEGLRRFHRGPATVKIDWALSGPIPWTDPAVGRAGTIHLADSLDELTRFAADLATGTVPELPFLIMGQMTVSDPTRSPPGTESAWAYTHVPQDAKWGPPETEAVVRRVEERIERYAPGFGDRIVARHVLVPPMFEELNPSLIGGDIGTSHLHQQLIFRPYAGALGPRTPIKGLYLASASAHPGPGGHGACGANAARAALGADRRRRILHPFG